MSNATHTPDCGACYDSGVIDTTEGQIRCPLCCMGAPSYRVAAPAIAPEMDGADREEIPALSSPLVFLACSECGSTISAAICCAVGCS